VTAASPALRIDADRLLADLAALARIGGRPDGGVDRIAGSPADQDARRWLTQRMLDAGLEPRTDETDNLLATVPGSTGPWLLAGSHADTVPAGGRLDGAYGVVAALEVLRTLHEACHRRAAEVEVVSFFGEEGVSAPGLAGSRSLAAGPHAADLVAYLELHIEQGPRLEAEHLELGVVEAIVAMVRWEARVTGAANHACTTPTAMRRDAGRAAARFVADLRELLRDVDPEMVGNVGRITFLPGALNVVPGEARLGVELRAAAEDTLDRAAEAVRRHLHQVAAEEGCDAELDGRGVIPGARMDPEVIAALEQVCERQGSRWRRLVSGAGHDAGAMAGRVPAGMLFVPSAGGVSHSPREHTDDALLVRGAQALLEAVLRVLERERPDALHRLDALTPRQAEHELLACCGSRRWAAAMAASRPFPTARALYAAADREWWAMTSTDWLEAFAAHPRIGDGHTADAAARAEQRGVADAPPATLAALAEGNRRYEERFGRVFLVRAGGRSAGEMLALLRQRLDNDPETELRVAAGEQARITRLRLERLLAATA
jgi:beta-ureidopropionase / N-carbamoyl-L-amino-acid hydrolase